MSDNNSYLCLHGAGCFDHAEVSGGGGAGGGGGSASKGGGPAAKGSGYKKIVKDWSGPTSPGSH